MEMELRHSGVAAESRPAGQDTATTPQAQRPPRSARRGSEQVYVDDLSYEPLPFTDNLWVTFADDE